ncbi:MAG: hypothetical protein LBB75_02330, partial [Oscillospiraceae bacterium]|nr:hypothetical protein [Oscillospiraceae bacterium]
MKKAISIVLALLMTLGMFAIAASAAVGLTPEITAKLDEFEALAAEAIADGAYPLDEILAYGASLFTDVDDLDEALAALPDLIANKRAELDAWFTASDWKTGLAGPNAPYATEADELDDKMENGVWIYHYENQVIPNSIDAYNAAVDAAVANAPAFSAVVAAIEALKAFADPSEYIDYWLEDDLEALADLLAQMEDQADLLKAAIKANTVPALGFGYVETVIIPNILGELADLVEEADWNAADKAREDLLEELGDVEDDADLAQLVDALEAADTTEDVWAAIDAINELLDARAAAAEAKALAEALVALEKVIALLEGVETENWLDNATDDYEGDKAALDAALAALQDIAAKFADDYEEDDQPTAAEILEAI